MSFFRIQDGPMDPPRCQVQGARSGARFKPRPSSSEASSEPSSFLLGFLFLEGKTRKLGRFFFLIGKTTRTPTNFGGVGLLGPDITRAYCSFFLGGETMENHQETGTVKKQHGGSSLFFFPNNLKLWICSIGPNGLLQGVSASRGPSGRLGPETPGLRGKPPGNRPFRGVQIIQNQKKHLGHWGPTNPIQPPAGRKRGVDVQPKDWIFFDEIYKIAPRSAFGG